MIAFNPLGYSSRSGTLEQASISGRGRRCRRRRCCRPRRFGRTLRAPGRFPDNLVAVGNSGKPVTLSAADIKDFRASLRGQLLLARDESYDQVRRVWNGAFDRHPALIARCTSAADVVQAVNFARAHDLLSSVRGGGHSISGQSACDGGLMIDLALMKDIQLDPGPAHRQGAAWCPAGRTGRQESVRRTGHAAGHRVRHRHCGLTLGGGQGRLMRKFGLSCDNVRSFEIVTANGKLMRANAEENPDLYWALRGGGGNFGVVTSFEYQLHPLKHQVLAGVLLYPFSQARAVLSALLDFAAHAPDELYLTGGLVNVAPKPGGSAPGRSPARSLRRHRSGVQRRAGQRRTSARTARQIWQAGGGQDHRQELRRCAKWFHRRESSGPARGTGRLRQIGIREYVPGKTDWRDHRRL